MNERLFGKNDINGRLWETSSEVVGRRRLEGNRRESLGKRTGEKVGLRGSRGDQGDSGV